MRVDAKAVATIQALEVVEKRLVQFIAQGSTGFTATYCPDQPANDGTSNTAEQRLAWTNHITQRHTHPSTTVGRSHTASGSGSCADGTADFTPIITLHHPNGRTARTLNDHETSRKWDQEGHSFLAS